MCRVGGWGISPSRSPRAPASSRHHWAPLLGVSHSVDRSGDRVSQAGLQLDSSRRAPTPSLHKTSDNTTPLSKTLSDAAPWPEVPPAPASGFGEKARAPGAALPGTQPVPVSDLDDSCSPPTWRLPARRGPGSRLHCGRHAAWWLGNLGPETGGSGSQPRRGGSRVESRRPLHAPAHACTRPALAHADTRVPSRRLASSHAPSHIHRHTHGSHHTFHARPHVRPACQPPLLSESPRNPVLSRLWRGPRLRMPRTPPGSAGRGRSCAVWDPNPRVRTVEQRAPSRKAGGTL